MVIWSQVVMPVRLALASTTWKLGWGIFDRRNGEFSTGLDNAARASPQRGGRMYNGLEPGSQNGIPD